jgi:2-dehydro-3-deoxygluconokinase
MMADVVTLGEALLAVRAQGRLRVGAPLSASIAGAEINVAIGLSRLDHDVIWIGVVGDDPPGDLVKRTLRGESVDTSLVRTDTAAPTALMLVDMPPGLSPLVTYHRRGSAGSRLASVDVELPASARMWHISGVTPALSDSACQAVGAAVATARSAGALISFDVNFRSKLWSRAHAAAALGPLARKADIVIASDDELALVAEGVDEAERIGSLLACGVREVVVKRGRDGAEHHDARGSTSCPAHPVTEVNSIGAGDAFTSGYLSGFLDGLSVADRLQRGALCGALAVTGTGDWEQAPTRAELDRLRRRHAEALR